MIIPVKCFTCGNVLANKYIYYIRTVKEIKLKKGIDVERVMYLSKDTVTKSPEAIVLDDLNLHKMCCRRHMLTHVDIV
tara:strand:- start:5080 stop:5313 length:234 start_codon:yes stop_codon:yes gene_type:complete